jgi:hypothetical protein
MTNTSEQSSGPNPSIGSSLEKNKTIPDVKNLESTLFLKGSCHWNELKATEGNRDFVYVGSVIIKHADTVIAYGNINLSKYELTSREKTENEGSWFKPRKKKTLVEVRQAIWSFISNGAILGTAISLTHADGNFIPYRIRLRREANKKKNILLEDSLLSKVFDKIDKEINEKYQLMQRYNLL